MSELIQYLQTLPIKPFIWIAGVLAALAFLLALVFAAIVFYNFFWPKKKRSIWNI